MTLNVLALDLGTIPGWALSVGTAPINQAEENCNTSCLERYSPDTC